MSKMAFLKQKEVDFALQIARQAAALIQQIQADLVTTTLTKGDRSPVTVADYSAQALVGGALEAAFPEIPLVGEEDSAALQAPEQEETLAQIAQYVSLYAPGTTRALACRWIDHGSTVIAPRYWTLDPIDGTKGFLRGDQYAVALAYVVSGQVQLGVLACPNLAEAHRSEIGGPGSLVVAVRGQGAWHTPLQGSESFRRLHVSDRQHPEEARILRSFESGHTNADQIDELASLLGVRAAPVRMDSQAKYAVLAAGGGDAMLRLLSPKQPDYKEKVWDQAAGSLVVEEAGGMITDLHGRAMDFTTGRTLLNNRGVLATNRTLHPAFLDGLSQIQA